MGSNIAKRKVTSKDRSQSVDEEVGKDYLMGLKASILRSLAQEIDDRFRNLNDKFDQKLGDIGRTMESTQSQMTRMTKSIQDVVTSSTLGEVQKIEGRILEHLRQVQADVKESVARILSREEALKLRLDEVRKEEERIKAQIASAKTPA